MKINYRVIDDVESLSRLVDLEIAIWGLSARDSVPAHILHTLARNGGVLLVAEDDVTPIGLSLSFPARRGQEWLLWSHMTGIHPGYQGQGIGYELKQLQRRWALEHGYRRINWTFDPLQRGNANFNIHKLGAAVHVYHVNYYGEMADQINAGLPSDRLEVTWNLKSRPTRQTASVEKRETFFLTKANSTGKPEVYEMLGRPETICVEIPPNLAELKRANVRQALEWRIAVREAMQQALAQDYSVVDFQQIQGRCVYILAAPVPWYMYVVQCSDQSLYTGITPDIARRVQRHNKGKGAAYTATRLPVALLGAWCYPDRSRALKAEAAFKQKRRDEKLKLIQSGSTFHEGAFVISDKPA